MKVPETVRVELTGDMQPGVMARDVFHHMVGAFGPAFAKFRVLELGGPALDGISIEGRQSMTCLAMFTGGITAICNPDQTTLDYALPRARKVLEPVASDSDASYAAVHELNLSKLEPVVVAPPTPADTQPLAKFVGTEINAGYIGSCASGRLDDLRAAAAVLKGRQVKPGFALHVIPTSQRIMAAAAAEGLIETLVEAGAFVSSPSCDYCFGRIATMSPGQRAMSTGTLNVPGRMGSPDSEIYIGNAASVAAAAVEGRIADPRDYLTVSA